MAILASLVPRPFLWILERCSRGTEENARREESTVYIQGEGGGGSSFVSAFAPPPHYTPNYCAISIIHFEGLGMRLVASYCASASKNFQLAKIFVNFVTRC